MNLSKRITIKLKQHRLVEINVLGRASTVEEHP